MQKFLNDGEIHSLINDIQKEQVGYHFEINGN